MHYLCCLVVKQFVRDLCNPVVGAVSGHLAAYVEAFKDVESSDQGNASMWGRGHHHMVSYLNKIMMIIKQNNNKELENIISETQVV